MVEGQHSLSLRKFVIGLAVFLGALIVTSALLSPPVAWLVELIAPDRWPFKRIFNRVLMVSAVVFLIPLLRYYGAISWRMIGIYFQTRWWRWVLLGWLVGVFHVFCLGSLHLGFGAREWNWELTAEKAFGYLLAGVLVGVIEECIFRGGLCLSLRRMRKPLLVGVVLIGSAFFALAHFPSARALSGEIHWLSGWQMWQDLLLQFLDPKEVVQRLIGLWLVGICLCVAALRTGTLWFAIGLHAGWVFGIKSVNRMSDATEQAGSVWWGGHPLDGITAWLSLFLLLRLLWKFLPESKESNVEANP
ncbi:MAG: CPBP family intramembrane glutamic endopeptidase [Verrucomicrobiota bacterium]